MVSRRPLAWTVLLVGIALGLGVGVWSWWIGGAVLALLPPALRGGAAGLLHVELGVAPSLVVAASLLLYLIGLFELARQAPVEVSSRPRRRVRR